MEEYSDEKEDNRDVLLLYQTKLWNGWRKNCSQWESPHTTSANL